MWSFKKLLFIQEISPGGVGTEIAVAGGFVPEGGEFTGAIMLNDSDVAQAVGFLLMTPYSVNMSEIIIKPTGEKF